MSEHKTGIPDTRDRQPMSERRPGPSSGQVRPRGNIPPDTILIGKKPLMAYATAVMMHFNMGKKELTVKARGRAISHAVDVVEVVRRRFFEGKIMVKAVKIGTEVVGGDIGGEEAVEGQRSEARNVSTIEIRIERTD